MVPEKGRGRTERRPIATRPGWARAGPRASRPNGSGEGAGPESKRVRVSPGSSPRCRCSRRRRRRVSGEARGGGSGRAGEPAGRARPGRGREACPRRSGGGRAGAEEPAGTRRSGGESKPKWGPGREGSRKPSGQPGRPSRAGPPRRARPAAAGWVSNWRPWRGIRPGDRRSFLFWPTERGIPGPGMAGLPACLRLVRGALGSPGRRFLFPAVPCGTLCGSGAWKLLLLE